MNKVYREGKEVPLTKLGDTVFFDETSRRIYMRDKKSAVSINITRDGKLEIIGQTRHSSFGKIHMDLDPSLPLTICLPDEDHIYILEQKE